MTTSPKIEGMKTAVIILSLVVAVLLVFLFTQTAQHETSEKAERLAKEYHQSRADSLQKSNNQKADSLEVALHLIWYERERTELAHQETRKALEYARSIKPVRFQTDQERDSVLKTLYPSIGLP